MNNLKTGVMWLFETGVGPEAPCEDRCPRRFSVIIVIVTDGSCCPGTLINPRGHSTIREAEPFGLLGAVKFQLSGTLIQKHV